MSALRKVSGQDVFDQPVLALYRNNRSLGAGVAETITAPATVTVDGVARAPSHVLIFATEDIYITEPNGATATVPGDVTNGEAAALIRYGDSILMSIAAGETVSVISESICKVQAWFYGR